MKSPTSLMFIGDIAYDQYPDQKYFGGCALNAATRAAYYLSQIGSKKQVYLSGPFNDENLDLLNYIKKFNIKFYPLLRKGSAPIQHIRIDGEGKKDFWKYEDGILKNFSLNEEEAKFISSFEGDIVMPVYQQALNLNRSVFDCIKGSNLILDFFDFKDFDFNVLRIHEFLSKSKLIFAGLENANNDLIINFENLKINKLITLAEHGARLLTDKTYQVEAFKVDKVIDSTGAGDTFIATFLSALMVGLPIDKALKDAAEYAAKTVQQVGCQISIPL